MKAERPFTGPTVAGLLVLFALISTTVLMWSPKEPVTMRDQVATILAHEATYQFIQAEMMAKRLYPAPGARWSVDMSEFHSDCYPFGNGVWYAHGLLNEPANAEATPWAVYFVPEQIAPLYAKVGGIETGDLKAALRQAGKENAAGEN